MATTDALMVAHAPATDERLSERLSPSQAALLLRCTPERVRQLFDKGVLVGERTALGRLVSASSVTALIRTRAQANQTR